MLAKHATLVQLPRRFLGVSAVEMPQWAPFGDGGRNCVGMKLAVEEAKARGGTLCHECRVPPSAGLGNQSA